eukprot:jgi/Antlo1/1128/830
MKVLHAKTCEEIAFGLRFVGEICEIEERGRDLTLNIGAKSVVGVGPVLHELKNTVKDADIKNIYLADDAISKVVNQHEKEWKFESSVLKKMCRDSGNISIFDTVMFARIYRYLLEGGKMNNKDSERFLAVQEVLATKLNFTKYPISSFEYADLLVGKVLEVIPVDGSDKLYVEKVFASRIFQVVSGLQKHYSADDLVSRKFVFLLNIKPASLAGVRSEGMIMCASNDESLEAIEVQGDIEAGTRLEIDSGTIPVIKTFKRPVLDMKRERARSFIKNLAVKDHLLVFENKKIICNGKEVRTRIKYGVVS